MSNIDTAKEREKLDALEGHTPGPWNPLFGEAYRVWADGMNIATAQFVTLLDRIPTKEVASNTCLIAAAPDLKATLADALDALDAKDAAIERLQEALEKIRYWDWQVAEPHGADIPENVEPWARELDDACTQMQRIARAALNPEDYK